MSAGEDRPGRLVPPGDWPGDPAGPDTPVAGSAAEVASLAAGSPTLAELIARQSVCRACPRLVAWREEVAVVRRRSFRDELYWGRPIPGWGSARPRMLIVGLAPAAHGGNRTGRVFTGDRSGDFLFASLYRCGWAEKPTSVTADDGQRLIGARMAAVVRCAPPGNKPEPAERDTCAPWLQAELGMIATDLRVIVCLGGFAWQAIWPVLGHYGFTLPRPRPAFGHGVEVRLENPRLENPRFENSRAQHPQTLHPQTQYPEPPAPHSPYPQPRNPQTAGEVRLIGCYHPSQQNTFTGRVTPAMLDAIFTRAQVLTNPETNDTVTQS